MWRPENYPLRPEGEDVLRALREREVQSLRARAKDFRLESVEGALGALDVSPDLLAGAKVVLESGVRIGLRPSRVEPYEDGVALVYLPSAQTMRPGRRAYASLSVTHDEMLVGLTTDGAGHIVSWECEFSEAAAEDAVEQLLAFFVG